MTHKAQILASEIIIGASGLIIAWGGFSFTTSLYAGLAWMVGGNLILYRLKCSQCSKRLMTTSRFGYRAFGLQKCAYCGFNHWKEQPLIEKSAATSPTPPGE